METQYTVKVKCMLCIDVSEFIDTVFENEKSNFPLGEIAKSIRCPKCKTLDSLIVIKNTLKKKAGTL